jgi:MarR family 2-MHQ and catechol resistance regulon transcriptional repressor
MLRPDEEIQRRLRVPEISRYQEGYNGSRLHRPSSDNPTSGIHVWLVLWKAFKSVEHSATQSVMGLGLGLSDFAVLELLLHKGPQPVNAIGKKVLLTSGSMTTAVDRLESRQLVRRTGDPEDRRARIVALTPAGRRLIQKAFRRHAADMERALAALHATERAELVRLLKKAGLTALEDTGQV